MAFQVESSRGEDKDFINNYLGPLEVKAIFLYSMHFCIAHVRGMS